MSLRYHLSDVHGLWKVEWKRFGIEEPAEDDQGTVDLVTTPTWEDGEESRPPQRRKLEKTDTKSIDCSPCRQLASENGSVPEMILPERTKPRRKKPSHKRMTTGWTFVEWPSPSGSDSPRPSNCQDESLCVDEPVISTPPSVSCYPEQACDSSGSILVDKDGEKEREFDGRAWLEQSSQGDDRSDGIDTTDFVDNAFWLDDGTGTEGNTTDPTLVSTPLTDICSDIFYDLLDPALFNLEDQAP